MSPESLEQLICLLIRKMVLHACFPSWFSASSCRYIEMRLSAPCIIRDKANRYTPHAFSQSRQTKNRTFREKRLSLLTISWHAFLLTTPHYDACKPNLIRLRLTSAPKSMSLFSICSLAASANQCRNSVISASGSAKSPPTQADRDRKSTR